MGRRHAGKDDFAVRRPQTSFQLDREDVQSHLPDNSPPSLVMLALQCTEYEPANRPLAEDVYGIYLFIYLSFHLSFFFTKYIYCLIIYLS